MMKLLVEGGAKPMIANSDGETPIDIERERCHPQGVELLMVRKLTGFVTAAFHL